MRCPTADSNPCNGSLSRGEMCRHINCSNTRSSQLRHSVGSCSTKLACQIHGARFTSHEWDAQPADALIAVRRTAVSSTTRLVHTTSVMQSTRCTRCQLFMTSVVQDTHGCHACMTAATQAIRRRMYLSTCAMCSRDRCGAVHATTASVTFRNSAGGQPSTSNVHGNRSCGSIKWGGAKQDQEFRFGPIDISQ